MKTKIVVILSNFLFIINYAYSYDHLGNPDKALPIVIVPLPSVEGGGSALKVLSEDAPFYDMSQVLFVPDLKRAKEAPIAVVPLPSVSEFPGILELVKEGSVPTGLPDNVLKDLNREYLEGDLPIALVPLPSVSEFPGILELVEEGGSPAGLSDNALETLSKEPLEGDASIVIMPLPSVSEIPEYEVICGAGYCYPRFKKQAHHALFLKWLCSGREDTDISDFDLLRHKTANASLALLGFTSVGEMLAFGSTALAGIGPAIAGLGAVGSVVYALATFRNMANVRELSIYEKIGLVSGGIIVFSIAVPIIVGGVTIPAGTIGISAVGVALASLMGRDTYLKICNTLP